MDARSSVIMGRKSRCPDVRDRKFDINDLEQVEGPLSCGWCLSAGVIRRNGY